MVFPVPPFPFLLSKPGLSEKLFSPVPLLTNWYSCPVILVSVSYCPRSRTQGHPLFGLGGLPLASACGRKRHPFGAQTSVKKKEAFPLDGLDSSSHLTQLASIHCTQRPCGICLTTSVAFLSRLLPFPSSPLAYAPERSWPVLPAPTRCLLLLTTHLSSLESHLVILKHCRTYSLQQASI